MNEPIPVSLAVRAAERAIRECDAATPDWDFVVVDLPMFTDSAEDKNNARFAVLARAGFRAALRYLHADIEHALLTGESLCDAESAAVAPLIDHYDRVAPGWRTE